MSTPSDPLAISLDIEEEKKEISIPQNKEEMRNQTNDFEQKFSKNLAEGIDIKRLVKNRIHDTQNENTIEGYNVLSTVSINGSEENLDGKQDDESNSKCQKLKEEINFQIENLKDSCNESCDFSCPSLSSCKMIFLLLLGFIVLAIGIYEIKTNTGKNR